MTLANPPLAVIDASAIVALLTDRGSVGSWVSDAVGDRSLVAPHLMPFEAANILRRLVLAGKLDSTTGSLAHRDLTDLPIDLVSYPLIADRAWVLRENLTIYDATYVAIAEALEAPLLTIDARITKAPGIRCEIMTPRVDVRSGPSRRVGGR